MFFRRGVPGDDPWTTEKIWVFTVGALLAMVGMLMDDPWIMGAAGLLLLGGVLLRFVPRGTAGGEDDDPDDGQGPSAA